MRTEIGGTENGIDKRTLRAATESMTIVALGSGEFKVYSGTRKSYVVDVIRETCECPDEEYHHPVDGCKHRRRVEMELGERAIPELDQRLDVEIMSGRDRESETPEVATDGGAVVETGDGSESELDERPDDCDCIGEFDDDDLGCFACFSAGFHTANPDAEDVIEDDEGGGR